MDRGQAIEKHRGQHQWMGALLCCLFSVMLSSCLSETITDTVSDTVSGAISNTSRQPSSMGADRRADYQPLERLLQQGDWQGADRETFHQLLMLADRIEEGWLRANDVETIACEDWAALNHLWQLYSDRRFGFRIQARIWERVGGQAGIYDPQVALRLGEMVGWQEAEQWKVYDELNFSIGANHGHLPATTGNGVSGGVWGGIATISGRVQSCASAFDEFPDALQEAVDRDAVQPNKSARYAEPLSCIGCNLVGADLQGRSLMFADLAYADLRNANLKRKSLGAANLKFADLRGANLEGAVLRQANLWGASFDGAILRGADFSCGAGSCTFLEGASFQDADLSGANLYCLDCTVLGERGLINVNFAEANLTDAVVEQTSFEGVNLCGATLPDGGRSQQGC